MRALAFLVVLAAGALFFGTPHMLTSYDCHGVMGNCYSYSRCNYLGIEGWRMHPGDSCPFIRLFRLKWNPLA